MCSPSLSKTGLAITYSLLVDSKVLISTPNLYAFEITGLIRTKYILIALNIFNVHNNFSKQILDPVLHVTLENVTLNLELMLPF